MSLLIVSKESGSTAISTAQLSSHNSTLYSAMILGVLHGDMKCVRCPTKLVRVVT